MDISSYTVFLLIWATSLLVQIGKSDEDEKWKKKDVRDYTDADLERLFEQWEEDEEPLEEDELPEWKRPKPKVDISQLDPNDPEGMLKMTKKQQTLMMFATVSGNPTEKETETITQLWQGSLFNANYEIQRFIVGSDRVLFMLKDGSKAWEIKDFLVAQERCASVTIEGKDYHGKGYEGEQESNDSSKKPSNVKKAKPTEESKKLAENRANEIRKDEF